ncbi:hypothetical protein OV079_02485 [Nannocystis pusilla]|uniref:Uncharacterized protein n=1 Tax=Nannocystis pusilla TaxID=889268 RepID=A0A9X3IW59_9BACT|nr:hypothetical protein [Nannocystis pusilla]MCY1004453.1 hypothetical protein [Nannocystis pusilla]
MLYSEITLQESNRSGRTVFKIVEGKKPVAPGSFIVFEQPARPGWATGCYVLKYRLANNGNNHDDIQIEWFIDDYPLDAVHYGDDIYQLNNTFIGDGKLPVPLARGKHCCIGANNRLRAKISHIGTSNQVENIRLYVEHANAVKCCSGCAAGRGCQSGCKNAKDE